MGNNPIELIREKSKENLLFFAKYVVYRDRKPNLIQTYLGSVHRRMAEFYERTERSGSSNPYPRTLLLAPRGHFKTSLMVVAHALWSLVRDPNKRILIVSAKRELARQILSEIKERIEHNAVLSRWFPELLPGGAWTQERIVIAGRTQTQKEPSIRSVGISTTITGEHYDLIYLDDVVTDETVRTTSRLNATWSYLKTLTPILHMGGREAQLRITGTRYHADDIYGRILRLNKKAEELGKERPYEVLILSAWEPAANGGYLPIFPEAFPMKYLQQLREMDRRGFAHQYLNQVIDREDQLFTIDELESMQVTWHDIDRDKFDTWSAYCMVDPAISTDEASDNSAIVTWKYDSDGVAYVYDIWAQRVKPDDLLAQVYNLHMKYNYRMIFFEANGFQEIYQQMFRRLAPSRGWIPIVPVKHKAGDSKVRRIESLQLFARQGFLKFIMPLHNWDRFIDEAISFPRAAHDDILDAMAEIPRHRPGQKAVVTRITESRPVLPFETHSPDFGDWEF